MTFTVIKCNANGEEVLRYTADVLERGKTSICVRAIFQIEKADIGVAVFRRGDVFTEWFYSDRWYNVFKIEAGDTGQLTGWYCNVTRPAVITDTSVRADDLAMDVFVNPAGETCILDEDEFRALDLTATERASAQNAVNHILQAVNARQPPFDGIEDEMG